MVSEFFKTIEEVPVVGLRVRVDSEVVFNNVSLNPGTNRPSPRTYTRLE